MKQVLPIYFAVYLVNTIIMAEEAIPPPDLYWSFDNQCSDSCSTCFDSNIPTGIPEYRLTGGCNSTITTDPLIEGVVGDAMSLKGQEVKIFNASETCITVLDKRMPTAGGRLEDKCTSFTLTFWTRIDSIEAGFKQVFLFTSGIYDPLAATYPSSTGISVSIVSTGNIVARVQTPGVFHERVIHESFKEGVWTHLTLVWIKNQHLKLYINGTLKESSDTPTLIDYPNINRPYEIIFGTEDLFNFTIDEVKIWFKSYAGNISEIFRQASVDPSDFTTPLTTTPGTRTLEASNDPTNCTTTPLTTTPVCTLVQQSNPTTTTTTTATTTTTTKTTTTRPTTTTTITTTTATTTSTKNTTTTRLTTTSSTGCKERVADLEELITWYKASNGYFYKVFEETADYNRARQNCQEKGGSLASEGIRNSEIRGELIRLMKSKNGNIWIGINDIQNEGTWVWEDGIVSDGTDVDWYTNQPDNNGGIEDCALYRPSYEWKVNDAPCNGAKMYLCERLK